MRILVVDDHAIVRRGMVALLQDSFKGVVVGEAENAREGVTTASGATWDLVIVDISMPGRSGLEMIEELKAVVPALPVLVMSSHSERDYALRALKSGAAGYVSKQSAADTLVAAVTRVLAGRRYISPLVAEQLAGALSGDAPGTSHETLSNRELQVLQLIATGKTIKEISAELALSEKTVATYRSRIAEKMGLSTNVELTRYAMMHGLVV